MESDLKQGSYRDLHSIYILLESTTTYYGRLICARSTHHADYNSLLQEDVLMQKNTLPQEEEIFIAGGQILLAFIHYRGITIQDGERFLFAAWWCEEDRPSPC